MILKVIKNFENKMDKMQESSNKHLKEMQPTPVFLLGESQGRGSLVGCHLWDRTESDMTEVNWNWEELENNHTNNTVTEIKNTLEGLNSRISEAERISWSGR